MGALVDHNTIQISTTSVAPETFEVPVNVVVKTEKRREVQEKLYKFIQKCGEIEFRRFIKQFMKRAICGNEDSCSKQVFERICFIISFFFLIPCIIQVSNYNSFLAVDHWFYIFIVDAGICFTCL